MLKFSEIFEFSRENSYFERIRMVRMVRMVRSLADRTFQPRLGAEVGGAAQRTPAGAPGRPLPAAVRLRQLFFSREVNEFQIFGCTNNCLQVLNSVR